MIRRALFQIHLWTGLSLGLLFVVLGLSGSVLVFNEEIARWSNPVAAMQGRAATLDAMVAAARKAPGGTDGAVFLVPSQRRGDPALVRFFPAPRTYFVDPVSARVLGWRETPFAPLIQFADELHGNLLMGANGRLAVGWLGIAMTLLGMTGLVLWWPPGRRWMSGFVVHRDARGMRLYRELHGAAGIWGLAVFLIVSITGASMVFSDAIRTVAEGAHAVNAFDGPVISPNSATPISVQASAVLAQRAVPEKSIQSVFLHVGAATVITMGAPDAPLLTLVYVDPWRGQVVAIRDSGTFRGAEAYIVWQKPLHVAVGLGPVWRALVFLSGLLPLLFLVTGVAMWIRKRRNRRAIGAGKMRSAAGNA